MLANSGKHIIYLHGFTWIGYEVSYQFKSQYIYIGFVWDATYQISNNVFGVASWKMSLRTVSAYHTLDGFVWKWVYPKIALWIGLMMINHFLFRQTQMWFPRGGGLWHEAEFALVSGMSCEQPVNRLDMDSNMSDHQKILNTSSTAQGGGRSFKDRKLYERWVVLMHGWQSESTDGPKGGWSCVFWSSCNGCSGHLTDNCWV